MSNIEENAFQVARYLLENSHINQQIEIKKALYISDSDFLGALNYLVPFGSVQTGFPPKYFSTAGQRGQGVVQQLNYENLQAFVNRVKESRIHISFDAELLLKFFCEMETLASDCREVVEKFNWEQKRCLVAVAELQGKKFIKALYADDMPVEIFITNDGKEIVMKNFYKESPEKTEVVTIHTGDNSIINFNSTLNSVTQSINISPTLPLESKQKLDALLAQLFDDLKELPSESEDDAEAVATMAKNLIENTMEEKPNKTMVEISAEGLIKAAKNISLITPNVLVTAQAIIEFIQTNFPTLQLHLNLIP